MAARTAAGRSTRFDSSARAIRSRCASRSTTLAAFSRSAWRRSRSSRAPSVASGTMTTWQARASISQVLSSPSQ
ncbi:hypothetical protein H4S02_004171 [Coemansia sp. RSA 2611]|nr:hypothetical protein H4S02_004171 [Coemansia sp. RSA 2611]